MKDLKFFLGIVLMILIVFMYQFKYIDGVLLIFLGILLLSIL